MTSARSSELVRQFDEREKGGADADGLAVPLPLRT